jgi:hypothetical protein
MFSAIVLRTLRVGSCMSHSSSGCGSNADNHRRLLLLLLLLLIRVSSLSPPTRLRVSVDVNGFLGSCNRFEILLVFSSLHVFHFVLIIIIHISYHFDLFRIFSQHLISPRPSLSRPGHSQSRTCTAPSFAAAAAAAAAAAVLCQSHSFTRCCRCRRPPAAVVRRPQASSQRGQQRRCGLLDVYIINRVLTLRSCCSAFCQRIQRGNSFSGKE